MKRFLLSIGVAFSMLAPVSTATFAAPIEQHPVVQKVAEVAPAVSPRSPYGYYIFRDGGRIHVLTTDPGRTPTEYRGIIRTNGVISDVDLNRPESSEHTAYGEHALAFRFVTANHVDGLSFDVNDADWIQFELYRDGHLIDESRINLGPDRHHPLQNPFVYLP